MIPLNIAIVCDVLGEENNGTTIAAMNLIRSLRAKGHKVSVICPDQQKNGEEGFYVVPTYNLGFLNNYVAKNGVALGKPIPTILERALKDADVIHIMIPFALGRAAMKYARAHRIPLTAGFHCQAENFTNHIFMMNARLVNHLTYRVFYQSLYRYCDCVHYPTQFICDLFEQETKPTNHYVISNGVNAAFVRKKVPKPQNLSDRFIILSTGRYSKEKAQQVLIDAISKSHHRGQIQLILAGKGPRQDYLKKYAQKAGILPPIFDFYSRQELIDVINYSDLYVHPAVIEIEAIACLEAIACGKVPVISDSKRSATRNFALTPQNLFHCNDSDDLAQKIDYWIEHPKQRKECEDQYLGFAKEFDFSICMDKMEEMLCDAAKQKKNG